MNEHTNIKKKSTTLFFLNHKNVRWGTSALSQMRCSSRKKPPPTMRTKKKKEKKKKKKTTKNVFVFAS